MTDADDPIIDTDTSPRKLSDLPRVLTEKYFPKESRSPVSPSPDTPGSVPPTPATDQRIATAARDKDVREIVRHFNTTGCKIEGVTLNSFIRAVLESASPTPKDAVQDTRAISFAVHLALYECLRVLDTRDSPLGFLADEARRALRRAWVATHDKDYDNCVPEADVERSMFAHWQRSEADRIERTDLLIGFASRGDSGEIQRDTPEQKRRDSWFRPGETKDAALSDLAERLNVK